MTVLKLIFYTPKFWIKCKYPQINSTWTGDGNRNSNRNGLKLSWDNLVFDCYDWGFDIEIEAFLTKTKHLLKKNTKF